MPQYRNQIQITADVLAAVREAGSEGQVATITVLMRKSNVSYVRLNKLLSQLVGFGLVERRATGNYVLSGKGLNFLHQYSEFDEFAESFGLRL